MPDSLFHDLSNAPQATTSLSRQAKATTARNSCNGEAFAAVHVAAPKIRLTSLNVTTATRRYGVYAPEDIPGRHGKTTLCPLDTFYAFIRAIGKAPIDQN